MITTVNLLIVGVSLFSYFAFNAPEECPKEYMTLKKDGGQLDSLGHIHKYCDTHDNFKTWHLKNPITFDEILTNEEKNND